MGNKVQLLIELDIETRSLQVKGPVEDFVLVYGMLEEAKFAITNSRLGEKVEKETPIIKIPKMVPPKDVNG
jgi:hypothetical protein